MEHDGCKGCKYEYRNEHLEPCFHCDGTKDGDHYERMKNADRIRSMSDAELSEFLMSDIPCDLDTTRCDDAYCDETWNCKKCIMDWLQSEVEE